MTTMIPESDADRVARLEAILDELILKIMVNLNQHGYGTAEILAALDDVCEKRQKAYEEDPDPAEDP